jgi:ATP-dependent protease ClpP protease subunit
MATFIEILKQEKPDTIYCLFSSSGGNVDPAITLYNFLRALPVEIIMHNTGSVESIGNIVFLAADTRFASAHSSFLLHGIVWNFAANSTITRSQFTEFLSGLTSSEAKISGIITERTQLTAADVTALFAQGESKDAAFALSKGIVQKIKNPEIPKGANIFSFNLT